MTLLLTCSQVTDRITDYLEGATSLSLRWRMRTHILVCPGCRAFLRSLQRLPDLVTRALSQGSEPPAEARAALNGALAHLARVGQPSDSVANREGNPLAGMPPSE